MLFELIDSVMSAGIIRAIIHIVPTKRVCTVPNKKLGEG